MSGSATTIETPSRTTTKDSAQSTDQVKAESELLNLDSMDRFSFQGHEYTPEELNRNMMRHADYTRKTQEISSERKFWKNLRSDLEHVRSNPNLADQFRKLYPDEFHDYLDFVQPKRNQRVEENDNGEEFNDNLPKHVLDRLKKLDQLEARLEKLDADSSSRQQAVADKHLDVIFGRFSEKYPYAIEDVVLNQAEKVLAENLENPHFKMTDGAWERIFRQVNDTYKSRFESKYRSQVEAQIEKSKRASDSAPGGSAPGRGPSGPKTIKEATEMMMQDLSAKGAR